MPEMRLIKIPELFVDPRERISQSASETDVYFFFLPVTLKIITYHLSFLSILTFYVA